jgi:hypothetical protein
MVAAVVAAAPAAAIGTGGFDPHVTPPVIPGTSTAVDEWRLAGQGFAQGVQIAPQWIMASGHAHPILNSTFRNEYGSAVVDKIAGVCAVAGSGCDVSVAHLATPINAPSFPPLLLDGVPQPGTTVTGNTLAVGNGGSTNGRPSVAWVPDDVTLAALQGGLVTDINGDSGGPAFYYAPGSTTGVLQGLNSTMAYGVLSGLQPLNSTKVKPFLDSVLPAGTVTWVAFSQLGPAPLVPEPVPNPTVTTTATSITATWPAVTSNPPVISYRAVLVRTDNILATTVISTDAATHTATFTGVTPNVPYGVFVLPSNTNGESRAPATTIGGAAPPGPATATWPTVIAAVLQPTGPAGLTVTTGPGQLKVSVVPGEPPIPGVTTFEATVGQCNASPCSAAATTQIADTTFAFNGSPHFVQLPANTPAGTEFQVQVREQNTSGVSAPVSQLVTYVPLAAPLPPNSLTVTPQADGTTAVSFAPTPADPAPGALTGFTPHAPADSYALEVDIPGQGTQLVDEFDAPQTTDTFNIADLGAGPGNDNFFVLALSGWGVSAPLSVTAPLGVTPAPAPVTATRTPAAPPTPASLHVPLVLSTGSSNTVTWTQPASGPSVAAVDEYLVTIADQDPNSAVAPIVAEVPSNQQSYTFQVPSVKQYTVKVYALSQQAGASAPATVTSNVANYEAAVQSNNSTLWASGHFVNHNVNAVLATGTSPSVASLDTGGFVIAYEGTNFDLWTMSTTGVLKDLGVGMRPGTSPSIAAIPGGNYEIAYQGTDSTLFTTGFFGTTNWGLGMLGKTSPSITAEPTGGPNGGYEVAFNGANGDLWTALSGGSSQSQDLGLAMAGTSSPGITAIPGDVNYEIAYQGPDGTLFTTGFFGTTRWGLAMNAKTSPSITAEAVGGNNGGYQVAFEGANNDLWTAFSGGFSQSQDLGLMMPSGSGPAISGLPAVGGAVIAYRGTDGNERILAIDADSNAVDATTDTGIPLASGTSPAINTF